MNPEQLPVNSKEKKEEEQAPFPTAVELMAMAEAGFNEEDKEKIDKEQLKNTLEQIVTEQRDIESSGFLSKLSKKAGKAAAIAFAGLSLFAASGSFSKAEAGDSFFHKVAKQVETSVLTGMEGNLRRSERAADMGQDMGFNLAMQREQMRMSQEQMGQNMAMSGEFQARQARESAKQAEGQRFASDIAQAKTPEEMKMAKEKHIIIMEDIENSSKK
jgi:hypothetical protein